jgi:hypothetical protein
MCARVVSGDRRGLGKNSLTGGSGEGGRRVTGGPQRRARVRSVVGWVGLMGSGREENKRFLIFFIYFSITHE